MAGRIAGITIEIGGNTTKLQDSLKGVNASLKATQTQLRDVNKLLKVDPGNTELLKQKQELLSKSIEDTKKKLEEEKAALEQIKNSDDADKRKADQEALTREIIDTEKQLERLTEQYKEFGSVGQQQVKAVGDKMQEIGGQVSAVGDKITGVGTAMTTHLTAPIMAVGAAAMAAWSEVDNGLDIITVKTGASGEALESMQNIAKDIATTIPTSFETAGTAVGEVNTRFGVTGEELEKLSTQFIKFADLNGTDVNNSIDTVQQALSAFGLGAEDASAMLDTLNKVGQDTGINVDTLASNLTSNATAFQSMGMSAGDAATLLGNLEKAGIDTGVVMTGLSKVQKEALEEGVSMQDKFSEALSSSESAIDNFGSKAGPKLYEAFQNGTLSADMFAGGIVNLNDAIGSVSDTYAAVQDPTDQLTVAWNELKLVGAELGEVMQGELAPIIETVTGALRDFKEWFSQLDEETKTSIVTIAAVVAAIGPVVAIIGTVVSAVGSVISVVGTVVSAVSGVIGVIGTVTSSIGAVVGAIGTVVSLLGGPFTLAIAAVVAAGALLIANWDTVKEVAANLGSFLSEKFNAMKEAVGNAMTAIGTGVSEKWNAVKQTTSEVMTNVGTTISNTYNAAKEAVTNAMSSMGDMVKGKLDNIKAAYEENGGGIKGIVSATMTALKEYWTLGLDAINTLTGGALDKVKSTIDTGFNAAKTTVLNIMDSIAQGISNAWNAVRSAIKLPHFSISGEFSINPPKVPKLSVEWYAKAMDNGMILKSPTIFGMGGGSLLGAGEAGSETIVGTNSLMNMIKNAVGETVNNYGGINIAVYGAPGQSEEKLAEIVSRRISQSVARKEAVWR